MNETTYLHEVVIPNDRIPVKLFTFSAHNDLRIIPYHWHRSAEMLYVKRGKLNVWIREEKYELNVNDFIFINSKEVHSTQSPVDNEVVVLQIPGDFLKTFSNSDFLQIRCNSLTSVDKRHDDNIREIMYQLYINSERKEEPYFLKVYSLLFELGFQLVKNYKEESITVDINTNKYLDRLANICGYIKDNYKESINLNSVAEEFGYTPQYLSRMFQKYTGTTFLTYLNTVRLNYAVKQMLATDYSILEIAQENGFSNVKSFNKVFKDVYGMSPSTYRKKLK